MIPTDTSGDPTPQPSAFPERWILIYDADCGFCRWSLRRVLALDRARRLRPVALGTPEADGQLADLTPAVRAASWHLVSPDGVRTSAGEAAPPLLRLLRGGRILAAVLERMPGVTDRAYRWVAEHRSWLGRFTG
jgi:predicted DCC family thiol-disulfide oxidoreductase YuxK